MELDIHGKIIEVPDGFIDTTLPTKAYFSHSQFGMYKRCARQFEYRYIVGIRQPPGVAMTQGSAIHTGAEKTHKHTMEHGAPLPLQEAEAVVSDEFDRREKDIEDWGDSKSANVKDRTLHCFKVYYTQATPLIRPRAVEMPFAKKIGNVPVVGFIDLIDEVPVPDTLPGENGPMMVEVVTDLKFTGRKWPEAKLHKETQLTLYAHVTGIPNVRIDFLIDQTSGTRYTQEKSIRTPRDAQNYIEDIEEAVDHIKKGVFPRCDPTEWVCTPKFCGYYERCRGLR